MDISQLSTLLSLEAKLVPQLIFVGLSAVVALLIFIEGQMLKKTNGHLPQSKLFYISSIIDTAWFFVCVVVVYAIELQPLALVVPTAYGIYTVMGWIYGTWLLRQEGIPDDPKKLVIPKRHISFSQGFASVFLVLCIGVIFRTLT